MYDKIEYLGKSLIQHGERNSRIYLMKLDRSDYPEIITKLDTLAEESNYGKIFTKIPEWAVDKFVEAGFKKEAFIPKFYNNSVDVFFYSKFIDENRLINDKISETAIIKNIELALSKQNIPSGSELDEKFKIKQISKSDVSQLAELYRLVFDTYPFPIFEKEYLLKTMDTNIAYFGVFLNDRLIAASSAEMDQKAENVEMTDFATNPDFTGNGLAYHLLTEMEIEMEKRNIKSLYTIARSFSPGMNITFARHGYKFSGTLVNNTNISGKIESMNVWYKNQSS